MDNIGNKCAIFNYWWSPLDGHGASLTALALYMLVKNMKYAPCLIKTVYSGTEEDAQAGRHFRFIERYANISERNYRTHEEYQTLNEEYTHFIVGSDQVFRIEWVTNEWFLPAIMDSKNKIAMSASFGTDTLQVSEKRLMEIKNYVARIPSISLRELDGKETFIKYFGVRQDLVWIMDPVFLVDKGLYFQLEEQSKIKATYSHKKFIFLYILDMQDEISYLRERLSNIYHTEIIEDSENITAEDFLWLVDNSEFIVTDSYHGMCFSLIYNKPFYGLYNILRGTSRIRTLKEIFQIRTNLLEIEDIMQCDWKIPCINYGAINSTISTQANRGKAWLKEKLGGNFENK